jgi:hypothetical protein
MAARHQPPPPPKPRQNLKTPHQKSSQSRHQNRPETAQAGVATLLFDLLTDAEAGSRRAAFDVPLLASRLAAALDCLGAVEAVRGLPVCLFGASTGGWVGICGVARLGCGHVCPESVPAASPPGLLRGNGCLDATSRDKTEV